MRGVLQSSGHHALPPPTAHPTGETSKGDTFPSCSSAPGRLCPGRMLVKHPLSGNLGLPAGSSEDRAQASSCSQRSSGSALWPAGLCGLQDSSRKLLLAPQHPPTHPQGLPAPPPCPCSPRFSPSELAASLCSAWKSLLWGDFSKTCPPRLSPSSMQNPKSPDTVGRNYPNCYHDHLSYF